MLLASDLANALAADEQRKCHVELNDAGAASKGEKKPNAARRQAV